MKGFRTEESRTIAISTSDSPDMGALGLSAEHVRESTAEIVMHLFAQGANVAYGGDLRRDGYTQLFFELAMRYRLEREKSLSRVTNYLAWPVHIALSSDELTSLNKDVKDFADLVLLGQQGDLLSLEDRQRVAPREPENKEWAPGLTDMRTRMVREADVVILLGGQVQYFKGRMPGVAEEALLCLQSQLPLFLVGGFGGCTRDIAEDLGLVERWNGSREYWPGRNEFESYGSDVLRNELSLEENQMLAETPYIEQIITLILRGLDRLTKG